MDLNQTIAQMKQNFDMVWPVREPVTGLATAALDPVNGRAIETYRVPAAMLLDQKGQPANGTVVGNNGRYVIFLSDSPGPAPARLSALNGEWLERFYQFHEYGHAQEGDVFEDDPQKIYDRFASPSFDWGPIELKADGWAAHLLLVEARAAGNAPLAKQLEAEIALRGLPNPLP